LGRLLRNRQAAFFIEEIMEKKYVVAATGAPLEKRPDMFHWKGRWFPGLVDDKACYDDPEDSFNKHVHIPTALEEGLIRLVEENTG
jgi:hypothetical protein